LIVPGKEIPVLTRCDSSALREPSVFPADAL
jgi:hypothetical protein